MPLLVILVTFIISIFGFCQIFGVIIYRLPKGKFEYILTIIIWGAILYGYYLLNANSFSNYFNFYKYSTIVAAVISLFAIKEDNIFESNAVTSKKTIRVESINEKSIKPKRKKSKLNSSNEIMYVVLISVIVMIFLLILAIG